MVRALVATLMAAAVAVLGWPAVASAATWAPGAPTALSLAASPTLVVRGHPTTLTGTLTDPATGAGIAGAPVRLESWEAGSQTWASVRDLVTDDGGAVWTQVTPSSDTTYRLHHGDPGTPEESVSRDVRVAVRVLAAALSRTSVRVGGQVSISGAVGTPVGSVVRLERRVGASWQAAGRTASRDDGSYAFTVTPETAGFWRWRVVRGAGSDRPAAVVTLPRVDAFRMHAYTVTTRGTLHADLRRFRAVLAATYADPRGWRRAHHRFREVPSGGAFTVVLSQSRYLPAFSRGCSTSYSCRVGRTLIINAARWVHGSPYFTGDLTTYRQMLVNHETGHWLGLGHAHCPARGARAPVMEQQSKGMQGCRPNAWPLPGEVRRVS